MSSGHNTTSQSSQCTSKPRYSVIVPAYNEEAVLGATLHALNVAMSSVSIPGEVIVVDNNSSDLTAAIAREHGARVVHEAHRQISVARNVGARTARGELLFFVDADSHVSRRLLRIALRHLIVDKWNGGGAALQFAPRPSWAFRALEWSWNHFARFTGIASGCFLFCTRKVFEAVGGFSTTLYIGEDAAFSLTARSRGLPLRTISRAPIVTSSRKFAQCGSGRLAAMAVRFALCPFSVFSRELCGLWYQRPATAPARSNAPTRPRRCLLAAVRTLLLGTVLACGLSSCSNSGTALRTRYVTPTLLPDGSRMLALRNDYTFTWHWMLLIGVEGDEAAKSNAWTVEKYDVNGSKLGELALGSWDARDTWSLNYAIVSTGNDRAILTRKDNADTSYMLDIEAMRAERIGGTFPDDQTVLDDGTIRAFTITSSGEGASSIVEMDLDGTAIQTLATIAGYTWDMHLSPSCWQSRAGVAVWQPGSVGIFDLATHTLNWTSMTVSGICAYGDNRLLIQADANRFLRAGWQVPQTDGGSALTVLDTIWVNEPGITDVSIDAPGAWMVYKSTPAFTESDGNAEQPRIVRRNMVTGETSVLLQESVVEL